MPSAKELASAEFGINVAEMFGAHTEKRENIFLYLFEIKKENKESKNEIAELRQELNELKALIKKY